jgi:hypothetical protein
MSGTKTIDVVVAPTGSLQDESNEHLASKEAGVRKVGKLDVFIQGVALFSDGYNIQIAGYMNTILAKLYVHVGFQILDN